MSKAKTNKRRVRTYFYVAGIRAKDIPLPDRAMIADMILAELRYLGESRHGTDVDTFNYVRQVNAECSRLNMLLRKRVDGFVFMPIKVTIDHRNYTWVKCRKVPSLSYDIESLLHTRLKELHR